MTNDLLVTETAPINASNDASIFALAPPDIATEIVSNESEEESVKKNAAEKIVAFVCERAELFHDENRRSYITDKASGNTFLIGSSGFDDWLCATYMHVAGVVAREAAKREAISVLQGLARFNGEEYPVFIRCGIDGDKYLIDLCQPDNAKAIEVNAGSWQIIDRPTIRFIRNPDAMPLPIPVKGGHLSPLWRVLNIPEDMRPLVLAWLLEAYRPDTPFPVLELIGEEGTAKSTTQSALRDLIDPNRVNLRSAPRNREDLCVSASVNWLVSYENLSHLNGDLQDSLCTVSTGGGFATRKLYTSGEESTISYKRPVIVNAISAVITQQDLLGRAISLELPRITHRTEAKETADLLRTHYASILGGVMDLFAITLAVLPNVQIKPEHRPRMADFCRLGMAMTKAQGNEPELFYNLYHEMQKEGINRTIDASPVASAILAFLENNPNGITATPQNILKELENYRPERSDAWPKSGKGMGDALRRLSPALNKVGNNCRPRPDLSTRNGKQWTIEKNNSPETKSTKFTMFTKSENGDEMEADFDPKIQLGELGELGELIFGDFNALNMHNTALKTQSNEDCLAELDAEDF